MSQDSVMEFALARSLACLPTDSGWPRRPAASPLPLRSSAAQEPLDRHSRRSLPGRCAVPLRGMIAVVVPVALRASHARAPSGPAWGAPRRRVTFHALADIRQQTGVQVDL